MTTFVKDQIAELLKAQSAAMFLVNEMEHNGDSNQIRYAINALQNITQAISMLTKVGE
jgi:hypothetical protein